MSAERRRHRPSRAALDARRARPLQLRAPIAEENVSPVNAPHRARPAPDGRLLLVRHGPGRGRIPRYMDRPLAFLADHDPELRARIRVHETGSGPPDLRDVGAVAFFLADPLAERYPRCHGEATTLARRARETGLPVLNPPDRLSNTRKERQAGRWREAGLPTPPCRRVRDREELFAAADAFGLPLLLRAELGHAQHGLRVLRTAGELEVFDPGGAWLTASPLEDVRAGYREAGGDWERGVRHPELWRRYHHKKRVYVVGEELVPFHLFFADRPAVSLAASLYGPWRGWLLGAGHVPWPLSSLALLSDEIRAAIEEEQRFGREGPEVPDLLRRAVRSLGLDYAAVDYATRADGRPVLWEANAHPANLTPAHVPLRRERGAVDRIETLYRTIGELFRRLLAGERPPSAKAGESGASEASGAP